MQEEKLSVGEMSCVDRLLLICRLLFGLEVPEKSC